MRSHIVTVVLLLLWRLAEANTNYAVVEGYQLFTVSFSSSNLLTAATTACSVRTNGKPWGNYPVVSNLCGGAIFGHTTILESAAEWAAVSTFVSSTDTIFVGNTGTNDGNCGNSGQTFRGYCSGVGALDWCDASGTFACGSGQSTCNLMCATPPTVSGGIVSVLPVAAISATAITQLDFQMTLAADLAISDTITITASHSIWAATATTTCNLDQSGAISETAATTSLAILEVTLGQAITAASGAVTITCTDNLGVFSADSDVVTFSFATTNDLAQTSITGWTVAPLVTGAGNDPIAQFGNVSQMFYLPVDVPVEILKTPEVKIVGVTFAGDDNEQWFRRFVVSHVDGSLVAQVSIKRNLASFNRSKSRTSELESLDVKLGPLQVPVTSIPHEGQHFQFSGNTRLTISRFSELHAHVRQWTIGRARREVVSIIGDHAAFHICASPASEYYGPQSHLAIKYAHLDIIVRNVKDVNRIEGVLPELWGFRPLSDEAKLYLTPPNKSSGIQASGIAS